MKAGAGAQLAELTAHPQGPGLRPQQGTNLCDCPRAGRRGFRRSRSALKELEFSLDYLRPCLKTTKQKSKQHTHTHTHGQIFTRKCDFCWRRKGLGDPALHPDLSSLDKQLTTWNSHFAIHTHAVLRSCGSLNNNKTRNKKQTPRNTSESPCGSPSRSWSMQTSLLQPLVPWLLTSTLKSSGRRSPRSERVATFACNPRLGS